MTAEEIVSAIAAGVADALKTKQLFLGVEKLTFKNADIHPEYVVTVKVAERLASFEREVVLEALMRTIKSSAIGLARLRAVNDTSAWPKIDQKSLPYQFGKQRLDILVRVPDHSPPVLLVEAKLDVKNVGGICDDVDRIMNLLSMYDDLNLLTQESPYGAVLFHVMKERATPAELEGIGNNLVSALTTRLEDWKLRRSWLHFKCGLLRRAEISEPVSGYEEHYPDGSSESVFAKESFAFAPGLVLMGANSDIESVCF